MVIRTTSSTLQGLLLLGATGAAAHRKGLRFASVWAGGVEQQGLVLVILLQQRRVLEPRNHSLLALDACKGHRAHLLRVEALPTLPVEGVDEGGNVLRVEKVDEAVPHVATILEVDGQVEEIVRALMPDIDFLQQHLLVVLVGDVANLIVRTNDIRKQ